MRSNYRSRNTFERQFPPQLSAVTSLVSISSALLLFDNRRRSIWRCGVECAASGAQFNSSNNTRDHLVGAQMCIYECRRAAIFCTEMQFAVARNMEHIQRLRHPQTNRAACSRFSPRPRPNSHFAASRARAHKSRA